MNPADLFASLVFGLAIPLCLASLLRPILGDRWPSAEGSRTMSGAPLAMGLSLIAGPGILIDRLVSAWRDGLLAPDEALSGGAAALGWALLYGFVALSLLSA